MVAKSNVLTLSHETYIWVWQDGKYIRRPESHFLDFVIDGVPLRQRVPETESTDLVTDLNRAWLDSVDEAVEMLLGQRPHPDLPPGRIAVLVCGLCGHVGCGALTAALHINETEARWSDWRWEDLSGEHPVQVHLPSFTFDRTSYETLLLTAFDQLNKLPHDESEHVGKPFLWPWQWGWRLPRD